MITPTEELHWRTKGYVIPDFKLEIESTIIEDVKRYYSKTGIPEDFGDDDKLVNKSILPIRSG